jgi:hypothetical protein
MDMQEFLAQYAANLLESLKDHSSRIDGISWTCDLCPLKEQCGKDSEENPDDCTTCGQYIQKSVTDGAKYKA